MKNLWSDIQNSLNSNLKLIHLTSAPVSVKEVAKYAFNFEFDNHLDKPLVSYDLKPFILTNGKTQLIAISIQNKHLLKLLKNTPY